MGRPNFLLSYYKIQAWIARRSLKSHLRRGSHEGFIPALVQELILAKTDALEWGAKGVFRCLYSQ